MRVTVNSMKRLRNSTNGNPKWEIRTSHGTFVTKTDTSIAYSLTGNEHGEHEITTDRRGNVVDFR